jgi:hypothetical protein
MSTGNPLIGDRSAREIAGRDPTLHTDDTNTVEGIHHTRESLRNNINLALNDLTDTQVPTPADGEALVWNATLQRWINGSVTGSGGGGGGAGESEDLTSLTDGTTTVFPLAVAYASGSTLIYLNGLLQRRTVDYAETVGGITFTTAPASGDILLVLYALAESYSGHVIQDEGINLPMRTKLNFIGEGVEAVDDEVNDRTNVTITSGGGGALQLGELTDVDLATTPPTTGDSLVFDGTNWIPDLIEGGSGGGHTIEDETTPVPQRANLSFQGEIIEVTDDEDNNRTIVTVSTPDGFANPMTTEGDLITTGPLGTTIRLPVGSEGQFLRVINSRPEWVTIEEIGGGSFMTESIDTDPIGFGTRDVTLEDPIDAFDTETFTSGFDESDIGA